MKHPCISCPRNGWHLGTSCVTVVRLHQWHQPRVHHTSRCNFSKTTFPLRTAARQPIDAIGYKDVHIVSKEVEFDVRFSSPTSSDSFSAWPTSSTATSPWASHELEDLKHPKQKQGNWVHRQRRQTALRSHRGPIWQIVCDNHILPRWVLLHPAQHCQRRRRTPRRYQHRNPSSTHFAHPNTTITTRSWTTQPYSSAISLLASHLSASSW